MKDLKIRILNDEHVETVDLWLASGTVKISRTALLNALFEAFHAEITDQEPDLKAFAKNIKGAVKIGHANVDAARFGSS